MIHSLILSFFSDWTRLKRCHETTFLSFLSCGSTATVQHCSQMTQKKSDADQIVYPRETAVEIISGNSGIKFQSNPIGLFKG